MDRTQDVLEIVRGDRPVRLVFQPMIDLRAGVAVGYEALARFAPRLSTSPGPWFTAAMDTPQAVPLETLLIRTALSAKAELPRDCFLSINVTPALLSDTEVLRAFGEVGDLSDVVIELTEHAPFSSGVELRQAVSALRERGARFALDDVGVGWAGLKQVSDLRPDIVKLDRSLVSGAARDPVRQAIAQMLLDLCSRLGIDLLVEGVESFEELDLFARMGVPLAQGYVFGRPESVARRLIDDDLAVRLKFRAGLLRHHNKVAGHVDVSTVAFQVMDAGPDGSASAWAANGEQLPTVVVDGTGRPIALVTYDESGAARRHPAMAVTASEDVASAAQRAMTRLLPDRFAPLVCVDRSGRHVGVVSVEALVLALAGNATTDDAQRP